MSLNTSVFGKSIKVEQYTIFETCPMCSGNYTLRMFGKSGLWECPECGKVGDWDLLVSELMKLPEIWEDRLATVGTPEPPAGLVVLSKVFKPTNTGKRISTGFSELDKLIDGFSTGSLTVITGKRGSGKSTFASQIALNALQSGAGACFYSGELSTPMFSEWMFAQAAGPNNVIAVQGDNGRMCYRASAGVEKRIRAWMGDKMILYDNEIIKSSETNTIIDRFKEARQRYGSTLFFVDNLMSARFAASAERDFYRQQSNFVRDLLQFSKEYRAHVVLMAHPRKTSAGDANDNIAGSADITNLATNVIKVDRLTPDEQIKMGCNSVIELNKNREYGDLASMKFSYEPRSRRFIHKQGNQINNYGWEF